MPKLRFYSSILDVTWELAGARHIARTAMTKKGNAFEGKRLDVLSTLGGRNM